MKRGVVALIPALLLSACVIVGEDRKPGLGMPGGGPPPWAPAHGARAKRAYYYYPGAGVYFDVTTRTYFYLNGGTWQTAVVLPPTIVISPAEVVSLHLDTDKPYLHYDEHQLAFKGKKPKHRGRPF